MQTGPAAHAGTDLGGRGDVLVFSFPTDDRPFARAARIQIRAVRDGDAPLRIARRNLAAAYPDADLHRQRRVLIRRVPTEVWFAYREGWDRPLHQSGNWWESKGTARANVGPGGVLSGLNADARRLTSNEPAVPASVTIDLADVAKIESASPNPRAARSAPAPSDVAALDAAPDPPSMTSSAEIRWDGGRPIPIEYHLDIDATGNGRQRIAMRTFAQRDAARTQRALAGSSLAAFSRRRQEEIIRSATLRELIAGEHLPEAIRSDPWVALVIAGVVRVHVGTADVEPTLYYASRGALLGAHTAMAQWFTIGLQAITPTSMLLLDPDVVRQLMATEPKFRHVVTEESLALLRHVIQLYVARSQGSLAQRLAREVVLLFHLEPAGSLVQVTEQQLAEGVGSMRESVGRTIAEFRRRGWIATTGHGIILLDPDALTDFGKVGDAR